MKLLFRRYCRIHYVKPSGWELFFFGRLLTTDSISLLVTGLFSFSLYSWFTLGRICVSRKFSSSSKLSNLLGVHCSYYSYNHFYFCRIDNNVHTLNSGFSNFFLSSSNGLSILLIFSKNQLKKFFYWNIVDFQCCVSFRCTAKWFYIYIYVCVCVCVCVCLCIFFSIIG